VHEDLFNIIVNLLGYVNYNHNFRPFCLISNLSGFREQQEVHMKKNAKFYPAV
jgi:hypothetical protein